MEPWCYLAEQSQVHVDPRPTILNELKMPVFLVASCKDAGCPQSTEGFDDSWGRIGKIASLKR